MKIFNRDNFKFKKLIYPVIFGFLIITGFVTFIYSIRFLTKQINQAFFMDDKIIDSKTVKVDWGNLKNVASKLNIKLGHKDVVIASSSTSSSDGFSVSESSALSASSSEPTIPIVQLDRKSIKIAIYNGTSKKGLAADLKDIMTKDGFNIDKTGTLNGFTEATTIKIKNSKKDYLAPIKESTGKKYQTIIEQGLDEIDQYDIIIIIGQ